MSYFTLANQNFHHRKVTPSKGSMSDDFDDVDYNVLWINMACSVNKWKYNRTATWAEKVCHLQFVYILISREVHITI